VAVGGEGESLVVVEGIDMVTIFTMRMLIEE
jgi:hypothetical protein